MWSLGVLILELSPVGLPRLSGNLAKQQKIWFELLIRQIGHLDHISSDRLSWKCLAGLLEALLRIDPEQRLSARESLARLSDELSEEVKEPASSIAAPKVALSEDGTEPLKELHHQLHGKKRLFGEIGPSQEGAHSRK